MENHGITNITMDLRKAPPWFAHWRLGEADSGEKKCFWKRASLAVEQGAVGMGISGLALASDPQFPLAVAAGWRLGEAASAERALEQGLETVQAAETGRSRTHCCRASSTSVAAGFRLGEADSSESIGPLERALEHAAD